MHDTALGSCLEYDMSGSEEFIVCLIVFQEISLVVAYDLALSNFVLMLGKHNSPLTGLALSI